MLAAGAIPITSLAADAEPVRLLASLPGSPEGERFGSAVASVASGLSLNGRGLAAADVDNDGRMDVAVNSIGGKLVLLRSAGPIGHWLDVKLDSFSPGALVTAVLPSGKKLVREVQAGSSYLSSEDPRVHFGLGGATTVRELVVRFPNGGGVTRLTDVRADRVVDVKRPPQVVVRAATAESASYVLAGCTPRNLGGSSVARVWDEAALAALRNGLAAPTVQARDLFHLSAAMWDAWAAYDPKAEGYIVNDKATATDVTAARNAAISYAAYRLLLWRASYGANLEQTFGRLATTMRSLCYSSAFTTKTGDSPAALGNRIAAAVIAYGLRDGSLERQHYADPSYLPQNAPMVVGQPGSTHARPDALAAAGPRPGRGAGARADPVAGAVVRRLPVGTRARVRAARIGEGTADRSWRTADRRRRVQRVVQAPGGRRHPRGDDEDTDRRVVAGGLERTRERRRAVVAAAPT